VLEPTSAVLLPAGVPDDAPLTRPMPQVREVVEWHAAARGAGGGGRAAGAGAGGTAEGADGAGAVAGSVGPAPDAGVSGAGDAAGGVGAAAGGADDWVGCFARGVRPLAELDFAAWCNLSDHRPLVVTLREVAQ